MFNLIGTIIFTTLCILTPIITIMEGTAPGNPAGQIANLHTTFNVVTSILLIPFGTFLAKAAELILPDCGEKDAGLHLEYIHGHVNIQEDKLGLSAMSMNNTKMEIKRMMAMAKENVSKSFEAFRERKAELVEEVDQREEYIDYLNKEISKYISKMITHERTVKGSRIFNSYFKITSNLERIGDHAVNIAGYTLMLKEKNIVLSEHSKKEVVEMQEVCHELFSYLFSEDAGSLNVHEKVSALEQKIDDMTETFRNEMLSRIQQGICSDEGSILFSEMLTDFERIGDHALNISKELTQIRLLNVS